MLGAGDGHVLFVVQSVMKMNSHVASDYRLMIFSLLMIGAGEGNVFSVV